MLQMTSAPPAAIKPSPTAVAARCAALRLKASALCQRSERLRARSQSIAVRQGRWQRWRCATGEDRAPALPRALPIGGGAATETVLRDFIATTCLGPGETVLRDDEPLLANGILDSLGVLRLTAFIEETFGVVVPDDALAPEHFGTVRRVAALVERLEAHAGAASSANGGGALPR